MKKIDLRTKCIETEDLFCQCGCEDMSLNVYENLKALSELISEAFDGFIIWITSGYRCETHNKKEGGAKNSLHIAGRALDFVIAVMNDDDEVIVPVEVTQVLLEKEFGDDCNEIILYDRGRVHFAFKKEKTRIDKRMK